MSEKPISVGDLVMVVHWPPCGCGLGKTGVVSDLFTSFARYGKCWKCGAKFSPNVPMGAATLNSEFDVDMSWLKRIDPPATGDSLPTRREIKERVKA